jgi:hypothetical protein
MDMQKEMVDMQAEGDMPATDKPAEEKQESAETFFLPSDFPNAAKLKPGESISLKVVGVSEDGEIEVSLGGSSEEGGKSLGDDLRESLTESE